MHRRNPIKDRIRDGDLSGAAQGLLRLLNKQPDDIQNWLLLAELLNEPEQRAECYRRILQFSPYNIETKARLHALSRHSDVYSKAAIASGAQSIDELLEEVMYADAIKAEHLPALVRDGLAHDGLEDYVLRQLAQYASHNGLARYICDTHSVSWSQAEEFVSWVEQKHNTEIAKRRLPLIMVLGAATMLVGVFIMWDRYDLTIGLAMFLGGLTGIIYQIKKLRNTAS